MRNNVLIIIALGFGLFFSSCKKGDDPDSSIETGNITISFEHFADGAPLIFDAMNYTNAAGNKYEVTEIQWFISDITLHRTDGGNILIDQDEFAHYIDTNLPGTSIWNVADDIPIGDYNSISITFGIKGEKNKPFMFTDPPESDMLWPTNLGGDQGGYHYMKLNGFWINNTDEREPFNFHLGVGQERDQDNMVVGFIQNWFEKDISAKFSIKENETKSITIRMNVEKWWDQPNVYDHNTIGGKIMQNQNAMRMGVENGLSVFTISQIADLPAE